MDTPDMGSEVLPAGPKKEQKATEHLIAKRIRESNLAHFIMLMGNLRGANRHRLKQRAERLLREIDCEGKTEEQVIQELEIALEIDCIQQRAWLRCGSAIRNAPSQQ